MVRTARAASQELNFHPPFVAGTPRHVPGGSALEYSTSALDAVTSPAGAGAPVAPHEDFRNYADGVYLGPGHKWWGPV